MPLLPVLMLAAFLSAFTIRMIDPLVPAIARTYVIPIETAALMASAYTFPYAIAQLLLGPLGDAVGKARVIKICLAAMAVCLALGGVAATFGQLLVARALAGMAGGGIIPMAFAIIGDRVPPVDRQVALARLVMSSQIAILFGSVIGGVVAERYDWRAMFLWPAALTALGCLVMVWALPARQGARREPFSFAGARAGYAEALANPNAAVTLGCVFAGGFVMLGLMPFMAARLEARGLSGLDEAGIVIAAYSVGGVAFTLAVSFLLRRLGRGGMVRLGGVIAVAGLVAVAVARSWQVEALAFAAVGAGYFMVHNSLQTLGTELAPNHRGAGVALFAFVFFFGQALGPIAMGVLFRAFGAMVPVLLVAVVLAVIAAVLARRLDRLEAAPARGG
jgi:predicted MFS family arabinose efflux permease